MDFIEEGDLIARAISSKIFWSWQSDYSQKTCRFFIKEALIAAIEQLREEMSLDDADRPEIDHDTLGERGMVDIVTTILTKIANSAVFVADLTPIARISEGKWLSNPNVLIELGWAMQKPGWERVIGVMNTASGAEIEDLPFDIRHRRIITYVLPENADNITRKGVHKKLARDLKAALQVNLEERADENGQTARIVSIPANPENPSIWASAGATLTHSERLRPALRHEIGIPDVPRSYMRVVPSGWRNQQPSLADFASLNQADRVDAPSDGSGNGNFGPTEKGFVRYWVTSRWNDPVISSTNMMMFFDDTGEFWLLHGSVVADHQGSRLLQDHRMLGQWSKTLRQTMAVLDRFGARNLRRVEAGLFGVKDVQWFFEWEGDRPHSRKNADSNIRQSSDWGADAQLTFLTDSYNHVKNLYALERSPEAEVSRILMQFDPSRFAQADH